MPPFLSAGAMIRCSMAMPPVSVPLAVVPMGTPVSADARAANIQAFIPMTNNLTFDLRGTMSNPTVAAATVAKLGAFNPARCVPVTRSPWTPGAAKVMINGQPALHTGCTAKCTWGGVISITDAGNEGTVQVN
jgi:hypothetical protein